MHPDNFRTFLRGNDRRGDARRQSFTNLSPGNRPQHRFARQTGENRQAIDSNCGQPEKQGQIVFECFAKTKTGIEHDPLILDTHLPAARNGIAKKTADFTKHITVNRCLLHRARHPTHVHDTHGAIRGRNSLQCRRLRHAGDVVNHARASRQRSAHHRRFVGIHGNRHTPLTNLGQHRQQAP